MKTRPWPTIIASILVILGVAPLLSIYWWSAAHDIRPLVMPLPLDSGEYSSALFETDLNDSYQIDLNWDGAIDRRMEANIDWTIVDERGAAIQHGAHNGQLLGNSLALGHFRGKSGSRQRLVIRNLQKVVGMETTHPTLEVGLPERSLGMAYGAGLAQLVANLVAGSGALMLAVIGIKRAMGQHT